MGEVLLSLEQCPPRSGDVHLPVTLLFHLILHELSLNPTPSPEKTGLPYHKGAILCIRRTKIKEECKMSESRPADDTQLQVEHILKEPRSKMECSSFRLRRHIPINFPRELVLPRD